MNGVIEAAWPPCNFLMKPCQLQAGVFLEFSINAHAPPGRFCAENITLAPPLDHRCYTRNGATLVYAEPDLLMYGGISASGGACCGTVMRLATQCMEWHLQVKPFVKVHRAVCMLWVNYTRAVLDLLPHLRGTPRLSLGLR